MCVGAKEARDEYWVAKDDHCEESSDKLFRLRYLVNLLILNVLSLLFSMLHIGIQSDVKNEIVHDLAKAYGAGEGGRRAKEHHVQIWGLWEKAFDEIERADDEVDHCKDVEEAQCVGSVPVELDRIVDSKDTDCSKD